MYRKSIVQAVCGLILLVTGAGAASAGSFQVNPVRATLSANQSISSLTVHNTGDEATVIQLELFSWSQQDGKDVYTPTREILATPPIFTIPANGSQVVRVGLRRKPDTQRELTYRLFLQEVPPPPKPGFQGLRVALRIGVPVFVLPTAAVQPQLQWQAAHTPEGIKINVSNSGNVHVQIANIRLASPDSEPAATHQIAGYVLPGQSRSWVLDEKAKPGATLQLKAQTDAGEMQANVTVGAP
jgi:fimbrial chaperone protein